MTYILNIETATKNCSVSVSKDGHIAALKEIATEGYSHAEKLHVFITEILVEAKLQFSDLSAIAVSKGPGSYTGLRIGVSAAKGLCFALNIPLIGVDTLEILSSQLMISDGVVVPMLDARRMEVYSAVFKDGIPAREVRAEIITEDSFSETDGEIHVIGDCQAKIQAVLNSDKFIYHEAIIYPSAKEMAALGYKKYTQQSFEDVAYFEPYYLKDFVVTSK